MAGPEEIASLQELQRLSPGLHLFCPREPDDEYDRFDEDERPLDEIQDQDRRKKIERTRSRRKKFMKCTILLAFDGDDVLQYQNSIYELLDTHLKKCDVCVRRYYLERIEFIAELRQDYAEQEIQDFLSILDRRDIARIKEGLTNATNTLRNLPELKRGISTIEFSDLVSLFEALHCRKFHENESLLKQYFDEPFKLIQTRKPLKIGEILPAVTLFLFDANQDRVAWAVKTWDRLARDATDLEWDYAIKETLQHKIGECNSPAKSSKLWSAIKVILTKLNRKAIAYKLFDLNPPFYKLVLDYLARPSLSVPSITWSLHEVLIKAPEAFWQTMGSISSSQLVESVFGSPRFNECLELYVKSDKLIGLNILLWTLPFLRSLKPAQRPAACHTLVDQLFQRVRNENLSKQGRIECLKTAIECMDQTVRSFTTDEAHHKIVSRLVILDAINTVGSYLEEMLRPQIEIEPEEIKNDVMSVVRNSLALEVLCLKADFEGLNKVSPLQYEPVSFSPKIWECVANNLSEHNTSLSRQMLMGITYFAGLDEVHSKTWKDEEWKKLSSKDQAKWGKLRQQVSAYNTSFTKMEDMIGQLFEKLSTFSPAHFDVLFREQATSMVMFAALFSGHDATHQAALDIIKSISGAYGRKEALSHIFKSFFATALYAVDWFFRRAANIKTFKSISRMLRLGKDIMEILCDPASGIIRTQELDSRGVVAVHSYWSYQWLALRTIFQCMERWSLEVKDRGSMAEICRDAMQYAQELFEHYHLFLSVLTKADPTRAAEVAQKLLETDEISSTCSPAKCLYVMSTWLRLRDEYLADTLSKVLTNMLRRLKEYGAKLKDDDFYYIMSVVVPGFRDPNRNGRAVTTNLDARQKAELLRALENYFGRALIEHPTIKKQSRIHDYVTAGGRSESSTPASSVVNLDEFDDNEIDDSDLYELSEHHEAIQKAKKAAAGTTKQPTKSGGTSITSKPLRPPFNQPPARTPEVARSFIEKRKAEQAAAKARTKEAALKARREFGVGEHTKEAGSGLEGIGVQGKDHTKEKSYLMVSSDEESSDEDDELFGKMQKIVQPGPGLPVRQVVRNAGPVRKVKQVRSQKDIRARLTPDLSGLHKEILSWDFFADTDTPPTSEKTDYTLVTNTFRSAQEYVKTFEPLLILEGWQSFRAAREDGSFRVFEIKVASSLIVDNFFEVTTVVPMAEGKELGIAVSEVVLLSKGKRPDLDKDEPHCLARVKEVSRKKGEMHIVYRVNAAKNSLRPFLGDKTSIYGIQILSLTPLEREYSALMALEYYDLCDEIIRAKPSPLLNYKESELENIKKTYNVNVAQARAVRSALDNDAFTLIQGPPGSGKTKTICAIVGAILTGFLNTTGGSRVGPRGNIAPPPAAKKILVCAPSNAAVDELVMRFKAGVKMMNGTEENINVVRLGRSDAINTAVKDVTLEELVNAKLNTAAPKGPQDDIQAVMMEHKGVSEEFREQIQKLDQIRSQGKVPPHEEEQILDGLKRKKAQLGNKIDGMREKQNSTFRDAELNRKRMQQEILDGAHILCATLSGSGHEIFQSLSIEFETVIIDEAAQSIELSALIPLKYGCSKCILVGDPKQLPPTVLSREAAKFQYEQSLFARMEGNHKKDVHLLDTQYRMHPEISLFPSKMFYDSRLKDGDGMAKLRTRPWHHSQMFAPYRFFDVQGMSQAASKGHSLVNIAELNVAMQLYRRLVSDVPQYKFKGKIGIITPYKGQLKELKMRFSHEYGERILSDIEFNTTDAFQGRESEIIIFSCVRASTTGLGFLNDIRRMNVGLTRAKCSLWVLGNSEALTRGEYWRGLVEDAKSRNLYTTGDILKMLQRPQLTADMMKDDVMMEDAPVDDATTESSDRPKPSRESPNSSIRQDPRPQQQQQRADCKSSVKQAGDRDMAPRQNVNLKKSENMSTSRAAVLKRKDSNNEASNTIPNRNVGRESSVTGRVSRDNSMTRITENRNSTPTHVKQDKSTNGASGGRSGLDDLKKCARCGSNEHFTHNCDNVAATSASFGDCFRCNQPGHTEAFCKQPRCISCGVVGHSQDKCTAPARERLDEAQRAQVKQAEIQLGRRQQAARERLAEKRLGEHAAKIPTVKNTALEGSELKRKRDEVETAGSSSVLNQTTQSKGADLSRPTISAASRGGGMNGGIRPPGGRPVAPGPPVKRKKATAEDMFLKRK